MEMFFAQLSDILARVSVGLWIIGGAATIILLGLKVSGHIRESWFKNLLIGVIALIVIHFLWTIAVGLIVERLAMKRLREFAKYPPPMLIVKKAGAQREIYGKTRTGELLRLLTNAQTSRGSGESGREIRLFFPIVKYTYTLEEDVKQKGVFTLNWTGYKGAKPSSDPIAKLGGFEIPGLNKWLKENL
jgi:hypothetical protein